MSALLVICCSILSTACFIIAIITKSPIEMLISITFIIVAIIIFSLKQIKDRLGYLILTGTFFVFLLSRTYSRALLGLNLEEYFGNTEVYRSLLYYDISLFALFIGELLFSSNKKIRITISRSIKIGKNKCNEVFD